jgi:phospholipase/carboxylesterase
MHVERASWGGLSSLVVHNLPADRKPELVVVLCHGFGAPGTDLVGLVQPLLEIEPDLANKAAFVFPAGPLNMAGRGIPGGFAWWMIDLNRLIYGPPPDLLEQFRRECPPGLPEARGAILKLIADAEKYFGLPASRFVLGGFSQGSMLAIDVALRLPEPPAGLVILSGALINESEWRPLLAQPAGSITAKRGPLVVLQSHGRHDSILPFPMGLALHEMLVEAGAEVDFVPFPGDHEIPLVVLERAAALVKRALTPDP